MGADASSKLKFHLVEEACGAKIRVVGIGGGGGNALNRMIEAGIQGVDFIAVNTDGQALGGNRASIKVQIGGQLTKGLGSGGRPETGRQAAMEDTEKLIEILQGSDMVFLTAGLGGGTGTGATPIIAGLAAELEVLCVAICTLPFDFESRVRAKQAEEGLSNLRNAVDTVIAIPNERLLQSVSLDTKVEDAFRLADDVLRQAVQGVSELITRPGLINLDFADVKSVMKGMGMAFMGTGLASGENRAVEAATKAISSPLLIDTSIEGAKGILINITGGKDMTLHEIDKAARLIKELAHAEANIIFGTVIEPAMKDTVKVTVIATGFERCPDREKTAVGTFGRAGLNARRPTPPPFPVQTEETPPYVFVPKGGGDRPRPAAPEERPRPALIPGLASWGEDKYEQFESPSFWRRGHGATRKAAS